MNQLHEQTISCPYCGENIDVLIDPSDIESQYIEDCQVCCRPINFVVKIGFNGNSVVSVYAENDG